MIPGYVPAIGERDLDKIIRAIRNLYEGIPEGTVQYDEAQTLTAAEQLQARTNIGAAQDSFNYIYNGSFETWLSGTTAAPTGWTLAGAGATVARNTTAGQFKFNSASVTLTRAGTDTTLSQNILTEYGPIGRWQGKTITIGCWVRCAVAARADISCTDGVSETTSTDHTGGGTFEFLTMTKVIDASATELTVRCRVITGNTSAQFDGFVFVVGGAVVDYFPGVGPRPVTINTTYDLATASGNQTIYVGGKARAIHMAAAANPAQARGSAGYCDGSLTQGYLIMIGDTATIGLSQGSIAQVGSAGATRQIAVVSAIDDLNITLAWTKTGAPTGTANLTLLVDLEPR